MKTRILWAGVSFALSASGCASHGAPPAVPEPIHTSSAQLPRMLRTDSTRYTARQTGDSAKPNVELSIRLTFTNATAEPVYARGCQYAAYEELSLDMPVLQKRLGQEWRTIWSAPGSLLMRDCPSIVIEPGQQYTYQFTPSGPPPYKPGAKRKRDPHFEAELPGTYRVRWSEFATRRPRPDGTLGERRQLAESLQVSNEFQVVEE